MARVAAKRYTPPVTTVLALSMVQPPDECFRKQLSRVPHFCLYAISLVSVCADGDSPPPCADARCCCLYGPRLSVGTRRLYKETTVRLRRRRCGVLLVCRRVRNNKMFLHEPRCSVLTLHKPSATRGGRTTHMNPLHALTSVNRGTSALSPKPTPGQDYCSERVPG